MPSAQASGAGAPPDPPRPPRRGLFRAPIPASERPSIGRLSQRSANNEGAANQEPQTEVRRFVGRIALPSSRGGPVQVTDVREVDQFINDYGVPVERGSSQRGRGRGRTGRGIGSTRPLRNASHQFTYNARLDEELQNRLVQNRAEFYNLHEIRRRGQEDNPPRSFGGHPRSEQRRALEREITREQERPFTSFDGAADSATPRLVRWPTSPASRQATARGGRRGRVSDSQNSSGEAPSRTPHRDRGELLGARLRRMEAELHESMLARPSELPALPPPPPDDPRMIPSYPLHIAEGFNRSTMTPRYPDLGNPHQHHISAPSEEARRLLLSTSSSPELSPDVSPASPPRSWTNGRPLESSMDGFDDSDLPRAWSNAPSRSMVFEFQRESRASSGEGSSSWPMGPLPDPFFRSPARPMSMVFRDQETPIANAFGQRGIGASFNNNVSRRRSTNSETEDIARDSRGQKISKFLLALALYSEAAFNRSQDVIF